MNTTILDDNSFQILITHVIKETHKNYDNMSNQILWEICKMKIKKESIALNKNKLSKKTVRAGLEKQISKQKTKS